MTNEIKIFKKILSSKDDPYLGVDFEFYTRWRLLLRMLVHLELMVLLDLVLVVILILMLILLQSVQHSAIINPL